METVLSSSLFANTMFLPVVFLTCILLLLILLRRPERKKLETPLPPGNLGLPFVGETIQFGMADKSGNMQRFLFERMSRYSRKVFKTSLMGEKMAVLCGPSGHKFIFSNENKLFKYWATGPIKNLLIPPELRELQIKDPLRWRKLGTEFFKPYSLHKYAEDMDSTVRRHMDAEWRINGTTSVHPLAKKLTFAIAWRFFMGIEIQDSTAVVARMEEHFERVIAGLYSGHIDLPGTAYRKGLKSAELLRAEMMNIIQKQKKQPVSPDNKVTLLSHFLSATDNEGKMLCDKEIASLLIVYLLASHGTTCTVFTSLVYYLTHHPHVYDRALQEQLEINNLKGEEKLLTWEDTKRMKYGRNVVNEVLRLVPPSNGTFREALHDIPYEGFTIPKGWKIFWSPSSTNKDPNYFQDPDKFDPSRFEGDGPIPFSFTPFGGGPRMCPGNEFAILSTLVFMHNLLIRFKWEEYHTSGEKKMMGSSPPPNGLSIKLSRRVGDDAVA